jgi:hypothetical protein
LLQTLSFCGGLAIVRIRPALLNLIQQLSTFRSSVVDERLNVLFKTVNAFPHFAIEALSSHKTLD